VVIYYCNLEEHIFSYYCYTVFFFIGKNEEKEVISLEYTVVDTAQNKQSDFQGPKIPWKSTYITATVLTGQCVNEKVGWGFSN